MIGLNIIIVFLTSLISLIILRPLAIRFKLVDYIAKRKTHDRNIAFVEWGGFFANSNLYRKKLSSPKFPRFYNIVFVLLV